MNNIFSIVTPSLNQGQFIEQTIQSVLSQEGDFYIDYIIADGGSTDNSVEIIKKYDELLKAKKYPIKCKGIKYRWWSRPDKGQSHAINQGFEIAKGDILAWINSDDYYEQNAFNIISNKIKENSQIDLFYGNIYFIDRNNEKSIKKTQQGTYTDFTTFTNKDLYIFQPSTFFTKKIVKRVGLLDEDLQYVMDYDLWVKILKNSQILYIPKILSNFRVWEGSKTYSHQKRFNYEKRIVNNRYCLPIINKRLVKKTTNLYIVSFFRKKFPKIYNFIKYIFYRIANRIKYIK